MAERPLPSLLPVPRRRRCERVLLEVPLELLEFVLLYGVRVLRRGELARTDLGCERADSGDHRLPDLLVALDELRDVALMDPEKVVEDQDLAVGRWPGADPYDRNVEPGHERLADRRGNRLEDDRETAGGLEGQGLLGDAGGARGRLALGLEAAERVD